MTNPALIAVIENGLHPKAKFLYGILHAYAGADGVAVVPESLITRIMQISPARLRGYRSMLNASGYCSIALSGDSLVFQVASDHPARESDHRVITDPNPNTSPHPTSDHPARESDHQAITDPNPNTSPHPTSDHPARESDHQARESDHPARAGGDYRGGRLVGSNLTTLPGKNLLPTNPPVKRPRWETESSEGLLLALGCENLPAIRQTALDFPFEAIRAHALAWQRDTKAQSPGGLLHRIRSGSFAVPEITSADRESSIFLRWRTPAELTAEEERERLAIEENQRWEEQRQSAAPAPAPVAPPADTDEIPRVEPAEIWRAALSDLASTLPAQTFETWVRDTDVLRYEDGEFVIGVPHAQARDWLHNRLRPQIRRTLGRLTQRSTDVSFAVRPRNGDHP